MKNPKVSIVIAVRNEARTIWPCIESLINQDYPKNAYEIIFADGRSGDKTRELIKEYMNKSKKVKIKLFDNPSVDSGSGRNIGIKKARGKVIVQLSGHTLAAKNLLKVLVSKLEKAGKEVAGVGCLHRTPKTAPFLQRVFGATITSGFGGFGTSYVQAKKEGFVESISFTAYWKKILMEVGLNDTSFKTGQDAELNVRIRKKGYKLLYTPKTYVLYHKRSSYPGFARQMFKYGFARKRVMRKHPETSKAFYLVPSVFVIGLAGLVILAGLDNFFRFLLTIYLAVYVGIAAGFSIRNSNLSPSFALAMFFSYWVEHISYGLGFIRGILKR